MRTARYGLFLVVAVSACRDGPRTTPAADGGAKPRHERIDAHVHTTPTLYNAALKLLRAAGVDGMVNLSGGAPGRGLEASLEGARMHGGRIAVCTNVNWHLVDEPGFGARIAAALGKARGLGAACLKIQKGLGLGVEVPGEGLLAVDDERLAPMWEAAGSLGMPVFLHVGDPAAFWKPVTPENERFDELRLHPRWSYAGGVAPSREALLAQFERVLARHPGTTVVGVHFGNDPEDLAATTSRMERFPNLWVDTAARVGEIGRNPPELLRAFFVRFQDRVVFGTDFGVTEDGLMLGAPDETIPGPAEAVRFFQVHWRFFETAQRGMDHPTPIQGRWKVDAIALPPDVLRKLYAGNVRRLLKP